MSHIHRNPDCAALMLVLASDRMIERLNRLQNQTVSSRTSKLPTMQKELDIPGIRGRVTEANAHNGSQMLRQTHPNSCRKACQSFVSSKHSVRWIKTMLVSAGCMVLESYMTSSGCDNFQHCG